MLCFVKIATPISAAFFRYQSIGYVGGTRLTRWENIASKAATQLHF